MRSGVLVWRPHGSPTFLRGQGHPGILVSTKDLLLTSGELCTWSGKPITEEKLSAKTPTAPTSYTPALGPAWTSFRNINLNHFFFFFMFDYFFLKVQLSRFCALSVCPFLVCCIHRCQQGECSPWTITPPETRLTGSGAVAGIRIFVAPQCQLLALGGDSSETGRFWVALAPSSGPWPGVRIPVTFYLTQIPEPTPVPRNQNLLGPGPGPQGCDVACGFPP